jgi:metal-responsive CopG/Arc/MetJ family transcriptional regulator
MANIKTSISIEEPHFKEIEALAEELEISRSQIFALAAREFIQRHKGQKSLDAINATSDDWSEPADKGFQEAMRAIGF